MSGKTTVAPQRRCPESDIYKRPEGELGHHLRQRQGGRAPREISLGIFDFLPYFWLVNALRSMPNAKHPRSTLAS